MDGSEADVFGPNSAGVRVPAAVSAVTTRAKWPSTAKANRSTRLPAAGGGDARATHRPPGPRRATGETDPPGPRWNVMRRSRWVAFRAVLTPPVAVGLLLATVTVGLVSAQGDAHYTGCIDARGALYAVAIGDSPLSPCRHGDQQISWNERGPQGPAGTAGGATRAIVPIMFDLSPGSSNFLDCGTGWHEWAACVPSNGVSTFFFDPGDYPASATVVLRLKIWIAAGATYCVRLFHAEDLIPVAGSEYCAEGPTSIPGVEIHGMTFLPYRSGYLLQENQLVGDIDTWGRLIEAYLDIEW